MPHTCSAVPNARGAFSPGFDADVCLLDAPDWRYLAYHLGGDIVAAVVKEGTIAWSRGAY